VQSIDISGLVRASMLILGLAMATGYYQDVQRWAIMEFAKSLKTSKLHYFFAEHSSAIKRTIPARR